MFDYLCADKKKILSNKNYIILHRIYAINIFNYYPEDRHYDKN